MNKKDKSKENTVEDSLEQNSHIIKDKKAFLDNFDLIIQNPSSTPYAHSRGSAPIKAVDRKHIAKRGIEAMSEQIDIQMNQILEQMKLLADQVESLKNKKKLSFIIYGAQMNFKPIVGESYYLYEQDDDYLLSILSPEDWGEKWMETRRYIVKVYLSGDYSWEILEQGNEFILPE